MKAFLKSTKKYLNPTLFIGFVVILISIKSVDARKRYKQLLANTKLTTGITTGFHYGGQSSC